MDDRQQILEALIKWQALFYHKKQFCLPLILNKGDKISTFDAEVIIE